MLEGSALCPGIWILDVRPCPKGCEAQWGVGPRHPHLPESAAESGGAVKRLASGRPRRRARQVRAGPGGAHCAAPPVVPSQAPRAHLRERWAAERAVPPNRGHALKGTCACVLPRSGQVHTCILPLTTRNCAEHLPRPTGRGLGHGSVSGCGASGSLQGACVLGLGSRAPVACREKVCPAPRQPLRAGPGAERARPPPVTQPRGSSARPSDCSP